MYTVSIFFRRVKLYTDISVYIRRGRLILDVYS